MIRLKPFLFILFVCLLGCQDSEIQLSDDNEISSFTIIIGADEIQMSIDEDLSLITGEVPFGVDRSSLNVRITIPETATINPSSGIPQDFSETVTYEVTAENGDVRTYDAIITNTLSAENDLLSFSLTLDGVAYEATINNAQLAVFDSLPYFQDLSALSPTITISDLATIEPASGTEQDFTVPVDYVVTAEDGTSRRFTVNLENVFSTIILDEPVASIFQSNLSVNLIKNNFLFGEDQYEGMKIFDISDRSNPVYLKNINSQGQTWNILDLGGDYVLMVERNANFVHVIDVSGSVPEIAKTHSGMRAGYAIVDDQSRVYFSRRVSGNIFSEIIVEIWDFSDPLEPVQLANIGTLINDFEEVPDHVRKIAVDKDRLFLTNLPTVGCRVYDISNMNAVSVLAEISDFNQNIKIVDDQVFLYQDSVLNVYNNDGSFAMINGLIDLDAQLSFYNQNDEFVWNNDETYSDLLLQGQQSAELVYLSYNKTANQFVDLVKLRVPGAAAITSFYLDSEHLYVIPGDAPWDFNGGGQLLIFSRNSIGL